jgi:hypothetical protein
MKVAVTVSTEIRNLKPIDQTSAVSFLLGLPVKSTSGTREMSDT